MSESLPLGPLIVGFAGTRLDEATRRRLCHPAVGGVILFSRNYQSPSQLTALTAEIAALRTPRLLISVDQEGGRVQRLRDGFTPLPPLAVLGRWYRTHPDRARDLAYRHGRVMAAEVLGHGIDLSFAPVLDLDRGSRVIGDRAMAADPAVVADLGAFYVAGMNDAGMSACGKHFPGHGSVAGDSHDEVVADERPAEEIEADLRPFTDLAGRLGGVMMAHVRYPAHDPEPAGYSSFWIRECLRRQLDFGGAVISDDLDMVGAQTAGRLEERIWAALDAGCDAVLVCRPESAGALLDHGVPDWPAPRSESIEKLYGRAMAGLEEQLTVPEFLAWRESLRALN